MTALRLAGRRAWALTEGHVGMEVQVCALAAALGLEVTVKRVPSPPWGFLPASLWPAPLRFTARGADPLTPPFPEVLISCGRRSVPVALAIARASREKSGPGTFTVHIQDPKIDPGKFDLVVAPFHDGLEGDNVLACLGSIHGLTPESLEEAARAQAPRFKDLPRPLVAVLLGGPTRAYDWGVRDMERLGESLRALAARDGVGLAVVPSRRTGAGNVAALMRTLEDAPAFIWGGVDDNPYPGVLGLADFLIVTCDSVNMTCEAAASGKPVYSAMMGEGSARMGAFHREMRERGHTRAFEGALDVDWRPRPLHEISRIAGEIAERFLASRD